jgi:hypothetical protein
VRAAEAGATVAVTAPISSMKMMQGAFFLPCSNRSRTREAPTPTNISTKSGLDGEEGHVGLAGDGAGERVLPVPEAHEQHPFGMRPSFCLGLAQGSMISCSFPWPRPRRPRPERDLLLLGRQQLGLGLAEGERLVALLCICLMKKTW